MPKVKISAPTQTSKEDASAVSAARLKICESAAKSLIKTMTASKQLVDKANQSYFDVFEDAKSKVEEFSLEEKETRRMLRIAIANVYCDGDEGAVSDNATANSLLSKYVRLCHPKDAKAAKELAKALDKGVNFNTALEVARGNKTASEAKQKGSQGGAREKTSKWIDDTDTLGNLVSELISRCVDGGEKHPKYKGGLSLAEIKDTIEESVAGFEEKFAEEEAASEEENED